MGAWEHHSSFLEARWRFPRALEAQRRIIGRCTKGRIASLICLHFAHGRTTHRLGQPVSGTVRASISVSVGGAARCA
eukprot:1772965-Pyramimonas_sp.AAC.1